MRTVTTKKMNIKPNPIQAAGDFRKLGSGGIAAKAKVAKKGEHRTAHSM
jgi:hypothetical protein